MVDNININNININEQHDVFYEEYHDDFYGSSPEFRWNANYRQLRRASELMYVLIRYKKSCYTGALNQTLLLSFLHVGILLIIRSLHDLI